jgi:hypothetical protein
MSPLLLLASALGSIWHDWILYAVATASAVGIAAATTARAEIQTRGMVTVFLTAALCIVASVNVVMDLHSAVLAKHILANEWSLAEAQRQARDFNYLPIIAVLGVLTISLSACAWALRNIRFAYLGVFLLAVLAIEAGGAYENHRLTMASAPQLAR